MTIGYLRRRSASAYTPASVITRRRRLAPVVLAALLVVGLPGAAWAAAPIAGDDPSAGCGNLERFGNSYPIPEDGAQVGFVPGTGCAITANDSDPDGDPLTWSIVTPPAHGDLILDANGFVRYTPEPDHSTRPGSEPGGTWASDSYVYQVSDGAETDTATHRFWIAPANDPPTFTFDLGCCGVWAWEDSGAYSAPVLTNISAGPGPSEADQTVTFETSVSIQEGDLDLFAVPPAIAQDGTLTFTPAQNRVGRAKVTVVAKDDGGLENWLGGINPSDDTSEPVWFAISIFAVDDPPVAHDDPSERCTDPSMIDGRFVIPEDSGPITMGNWMWCDLLSNDTDVDSPHGTITWALLEPPAHGTLTKQSEYQLTFEPDADYATMPGNVSGGSWVSDTFTYRAISGGLSSEPATMSYWIAEINDAPTFTPGADVSIAEDSAPYSATWATAVSPGPPSESWQSVDFAVTDVAVAGGGSLFTVPPSIAADGTLTFTAAPGASGVAAVTVQAHDDGGLDDHGIAALPEPPADTSDAVTFQITVSGANDAPVAGNDARTVVEDQANVALSVLGNDTDPDGDPLTITAVTGGTKGTATIAANDVRYLPAANAVGTDTISYTVSDGHGGTDTATVVVTITPINDSPVAVDDVATVADGPAVAIPVLTNDSDVDGNTLRISTATGSTRGTVAIVGGGTGLTYDPNPLASGTDTFTYTIHDGQGRTDTALVTVTIGPDASPPVITATTESLPGQTIGTSTIRARLAWAASDLGAGINNYHVQVSVNGGAYSTIALASPTATSVDRTLTIGSTYRFRVRAKDRAGNVSAFTAWPTLTPRLLQDGSSLATYTGTWSLATHPSASNGKTHHTSSASSRVVVRFIGRDVGWVATRTTSSGRAEVRIDGVLVGTVQLDRASTAYRQMVLGRHLSTLGWHTIDIRPLGDGRVDLDAIVTLH
jgi:large repetitive protein